MKFLNSWYIIIPKKKIVPQMLPETHHAPRKIQSCRIHSFFSHFTAWQIDASVGNRQFYHLLAPASGEILKCGVTPIFLCLWTALAWHKQCNYKPIHYEIIRLASGNTFRSMCKWKFRKYGSIKLSFGSYKCRRTHGTCSYKDPIVPFFFVIFICDGKIHSELWTYQFMPVLLLTSMSALNLQLPSDRPCYYLNFTNPFSRNTFQFHGTRNRRTLCQVHWRVKKLKTSSTIL